MRNFNEDLKNTAGSGLYCVWITAQDAAGSHLAAVWIDPAMTAFKSCAPETTDGIGTAPTAAEHEQKEHENLENPIEP